MKKIFCLLLILSMFVSATFAETSEQTRQRDITVDDATQTIDETLYTSSSGYTFWLQEGWAIQLDWAEMIENQSETQATADETTADTAASAGAATEAAADETAADATASSDAAAVATDEANDAAATSSSDASANESTFSAEIFAPSDHEEVFLTVQPSTSLTAEDADASLGEASYAENADATVGEIATFTLDSGSEGKTIGVRTGGIVYRYYFIAGDGLTLCVTASYPETAGEAYGDRMEEMVKSIEFTA